MQPKDFLKKLGLKTHNAGTWTGLESLATKKYLKSTSPVDGAYIGSVGVTSREPSIAFAALPTSPAERQSLIPPPFPRPPA